MDAELEAELQMIEAMYGDSITIAGAALNGMMRRVSSMRGENDSDDDGRSGSSSCITHQIITLRLRKGCVVEMTCPIQGYWHHLQEVSSGALSSPKPKSLMQPQLRFTVVNSPICVDEEQLRLAIKAVISENAANAAAGTVDSSSLIISVCQAAEQHVENVLGANNGVSSSSSSSDKNNSASDSEDQQEVGMAAAESSASATGTGGGGMNSRAGSNSTVLGAPTSSREEFPSQLRIVRGPNAIRDRKSTFIGYAAPVRSEREVKDVVAAIREAHPNACHPAMWAYRWKDTKGNWVYDIDDDGEKNAGKNILFVMEHFNGGVDGALVVVCRYYGGIHLSGDRFRHIAAVTRDTLEALTAAGGCVTGASSSVAVSSSTPSKKK